MTRTNGVVRIDHYSDINEVWADEPTPELVPFFHKKPYCDHCMSGDPHPTTWRLVQDDGSVVEIADECLSAWLGSAEIARSVREDRCPPPPAGTEFVGVRDRLTDEQVSWARAERDRWGLDVRTAVYHDRVPAARAHLLDAVREDYDRWLAAERAKGPPSEYLHDEGERHTFVLRCDRVVGPFDSQWGSSSLHLFSEGPGWKNKVSWFTGSDTTAWFEKDKVVTVKATVKGHKLYHGTKQTDLSRLKLVPPTEGGD